MKVNNISANNQNFKGLHFATKEIRDVVKNNQNIYDILKSASKKGYNIFIEPYDMFYGEDKPDLRFTVYNAKHAPKHSILSTNAKLKVNEKGKITNPVDSEEFNFEKSPGKPQTLKEKIVALGEAIKLSFLSRKVSVYSRLIDSQENQNSKFNKLVEDLEKYEIYLKEKYNK